MTTKIRQGDRILIIALLAALALSSAVYFFVSQQGGRLTAVVTADGKEIKRIDLNGVLQPYEFTVKTGANQQDYNIIQVEKGRIRVREANCPEQVDVKQGWLTRSGQSAVCLPHRVVVKVVSTQEPGIDGIAQ